VVGAKRVIWHVGSERNIQRRVPRSFELRFAEEIDDPHWRRSFLENVPENARTMRLASEWALGNAEDDTAIQ
jgi:hypothetical protein